MEYKAIFAFVTLMSISVSVFAAAQESVDGFAARTYQTRNGITLPYRLFVPAGLKPSPRKYPLVLWLHGSAGRGNDNLRQISEGNRDGSHAWIKLAGPSAQDFGPVFVVAPQCAAETTWASRDGSALPYLAATIELLEKLQQECAIDPARIYVVGQSMGSVGAWGALNGWPHIFAAAVAVSGAADTAIARRVAQVPVWVFQGSTDPVMPVERSRDLVAALKKAGGSPRYTEYDGEGHVIWPKVFADPEVLAWVLRQRGAAASR